MNILVVIAHPQHDSLCSTLASHVVCKLDNFGHEIVTENLYETNFDPVLSVREREGYYRTPYDTSIISDEIERLTNADALIIVFPTWWFSFPAILKGWFDRVWAPTIAYDHASNYGPIKPKLTNLKKTLVITTLGAPWWVDYFVLWRPVKRVIRYALLGACARKSRFKYLSFYKCEKVNTERVERFKSNIDSKLSSWFE